MKTTLLTFLGAAIVCLVAPNLAQGHHGFAAFDQSVTVTLKGTVTDFNFVNPHCVVEFEVKDDKGEATKWKAELPSRMALTPKGWTAASLKSGDELTISGYRAKNGSPSMWALKMSANGQELKLVHEN